MSFFKPRTSPGRVWPALPPAELAWVWGAYRELDRTQWLEPETLAERQLEQARALLEHAADHVPYYADLLRAAGVVPREVRTASAFRRIPLLARRTYQDRFDEFVAKELPSGMLPAGETHTSGTTGMPVKALLTNISRLWWFALHMRDLEWSRMDPRGRLASIRHLSGRGEDRREVLAGIALDTWDWQLDRLVETGPSFLMDIHQDPRRQLEWLSSIAPDYLVSFPSNLEHLASLIAEAGGSSPGLRVIKSLSETLTEAAQAVIERAFGAPVKNTYSSAEAGYIASPCPSGAGLHVHAESVLLEILDESGEPCAPGVEGRVVITTLHNFLTPLVRYEIMDHAAFSSQPCACGRGLPHLTRPLGKVSPLFHLPDGRKKNTTRLAAQMRELAGYHQFQIVQHTRQRVTVRIVPDASWSAAHAEGITNTVRDFFEAPVAVALETTERILPSAGGKVRRLICEVDAGESERAP